MAVINRMYDDLEDYVNRGELEEAVTLFAAIILQDCPGDIRISGTNLGLILEAELPDI